MVTVSFAARIESLSGNRRRDRDSSERHNRVISRLVGEESGVVLLSTEYSNSASPRKRTREHGPCEGEAAWRSVSMHELSEDWEEPTYWHVFSSDVQWTKARWIACSALWQTTKSPTCC